MNPWRTRPDWLHRGHTGAFVLLLARRSNHYEFYFYCHVITNFEARSHIYRTPECLPQLFSTGARRKGAQRDLLVHPVGVEGATLQRRVQRQAQVSS